MKSYETNEGEEDKEERVEKRGSENKNVGNKQKVVKQFFSISLASFLLDNRD